MSNKMGSGFINVSKTHSDPLYRRQSEMHDRCRLDYDRVKKIEALSAKFSNINIEELKKLIK